MECYIFIFILEQHKARASRMPFIFLIYIFNDNFILFYTNCQN